MFDKDFRQILRASLKLYNGTDITTSTLQNDNERIIKTTRKSTDSMLVKTAWDKLMQEVILLLF
jgi:hypothetical protein